MRISLNFPLIVHIECTQWVIIKWTVRWCTDQKPEFLRTLTVRYTIRFFFKLSFLAGAPNYYPNSFNGPQEAGHYGGPLKTHTKESEWKVLNGAPTEVARHDDSDENNYEQPAVFWKQVKVVLFQTKSFSSKPSPPFQLINSYMFEILDVAHRQRLVDNIVGSLHLADARVQERAVCNFGKVSEDFGRMVAKGLAKYNSNVAHF